MSSYDSFHTYSIGWAKIKWYLLIREGNRHLLKKELFIRFYVRFIQMIHHWNLSSKISGLQHTGLLSLRKILRYKTKTVLKEKN